MNKNKTSNSDLNFIKSYYKNNSYGKKSEIIGDEFDVIKRQTNKKTFNKVNKEKNANYKYDFKKHLDVMYDNLPREKVVELIERVDEANAFAEC